LLISLTCLVPFQPAGAEPNGPPPASAGVPQKAKGLTGTYRNRPAELKIQALGVNRLRVQFSGTYEYKVRGEWTANLGTADAVTTLKGDTAVFVPQDTEGCSITLKFAGRKLIVTQSGTDADCGFGHNVSAQGTYTKRSSRPPKFETF
ncbi:MAG: hypothetical protein LC672_06005, partial [Acidobacteria bacterium]|nr:hypothetical protein [Acidobacteriota bacterium]